MDELCRRKPLSVQRYRSSDSALVLRLRFRTLLLVRWAHHSIGTVRFCNAHYKVRLVTVCLSL